MERQSFIFVRCKIGDDTFDLGGNLLSASVTLGEGKKQSGCEVTIFDPQGIYAQKYLTASLLIGGIDVPENFFDTEEKTTTTPTSDSTTSDSSGGTVTTGGTFDPPKRAFLDLIANKEVPEPLTIAGYYSNNQTGSFNDADIAAGGGYPLSAGTTQNVGRYQFNRGDWEDAKKSNPNITGYTPKDQDLVAAYKLAYRKVLSPLASGDLATAIALASKEWTSMPGGAEVQSGYSLENAIAYYNQRLSYYKSKDSSNNSLSTASQQQSPQGNTGAASTATNYSSSKVIGNNLLVSYYGEGDGFDGKTTASGEVFHKELMTCAHETLPFGTLLKFTWVANKKSVVCKVNDRGKFKTLYGREADISYGAAKSLGDPLHSPSASGVLRMDIEIVSSLPSTTTPTKETSKEQAGKSVTDAATNTGVLSEGEAGYKGTPVIIEMGLQDGSICAFSYIHTGTNFSSPIAAKTSFKGTNLAFVLNRQIRNTRYENVTLKALTTAIARSYGMTVNMEEEGETLESISQPAQSDLSFLRYVCDRLGYQLKIIGSSLQVKKWNTVVAATPNFYLVVGESLLNLEIKDTAQTSAIGSDETIKLEKGIQKTVIDDSSGSMKVVEKEKVVSPIADSNPLKTSATGTNVPEKILVSDANKPYSRPEGKPVKEFTGSASLLTDQAALELLTPDAAFWLKGSIQFGDRAWFIETVKHTFDGSTIKTDVNFYTPVAAKKTSASSGKAADNTSNSGTNDAGVGVIGKYSITSPNGGGVTKFSDLQEHWLGSTKYTAYTARAGQNGGRISYLKNQPGQLVYDMTIHQNGNSRVSTPAPMSGTVSEVGGGYGIVKITNGNVSVRVLHMSAIKVKVGDSVLRGQALGTQDMVDAGHASTGVHTHIEAPENIITQYINSLITGNFGTSTPTTEVAKTSSPDAATNLSHFAYADKSF